MKQVYKKPVLIMESFTMTQSIAHNCGQTLDFQQATLKYKSTCGWNTGIDGDGNGSIDVLFVNGNTCNRTIGENDFPGVCYNNPNGGFNVFNS